jgi:ankyrin repeat protein
MTPDFGGQSAIQTAVYWEQYSFASKHLPEVDSLDNNIEGSILNVATARAAGSGNNALVEKLLVRVPDNKANEYVNFSSAFGTPLYCSAFRGNISTMESLCLKGAQINLVGGPLGTPLFAACTTGRVEAVSFLLKRGATLDFIKEDGTIVSAFEAAREHDEILSLLERFKLKGVKSLSEPLPRKKVDMSKVDEIIAVFEARKIAAEEEANKRSETDNTELSKPEEIKGKNGER